MFKNFKFTGTIVLLILFFMPLSSKQIDNPSKGYHNYQSLTKAITQLSNTNKKISKLVSIGKSLKGRNLWMLQISGTEGIPENKPGLLICANIEGDHVIGSEVALGVAEYLIKGYKIDKKITKILENRTFYIIPRLNPDGAELFFNKVLFEYNGNLKPRDDDYDWVKDEDGPEDLNGDNKITMMRIKDKKGKWYIDKKDPRIMKRKKKDTPVDQLYKVYLEGIDNDNDKKYNEDPVGGFNINRNFPHNFGYKTKGVGVHPVSEVETGALIDFVTKYVPALKTQPHKNISSVLVFSKYDNLAAKAGIECGKPSFPKPEISTKSTGRRGFFGRRSGRGGKKMPPPKDPQPKKTNPGDLHIFKKISKEYKKITGIKSAYTEKPVGSIVEWAYFQFGVPAFSANLWSLRSDLKDGSKKKPGNKTSEKKIKMPAKTKRSARRNNSRNTKGPGRENNDEKWIKWVDKKNHGKGFVKWTKYKHKQLGEVEIGGFEPYLRVNPPADQIKSLSKTHGEFAVYLASQFSDIRIDKPSVKKVSSNLYELKVKVSNKGKLPYVTAMGKKTRSVSPIMLRLEFEDDKKMKLFGGTKRNDIRSLRAGEEKEFQWMIISSPGKKINIRLWARKGGGTIIKKVVLK